jgi:SAM-dependent methyltransferase
MVGELAKAQRRRWEQAHAQHPQMYGMAPSAPAAHAAGLYRWAKVSRVLELGAGHGRDALYFARQGFAVIATDFSTAGLLQVRRTAQDQGVADRISTVAHDVRRPLPFEDHAVDAVFAHMLLCMALSTAEIRSLVAEVGRVLVPGGSFVYTVRNTTDAHYRAGPGHGDDIYENDGFAVHFFDRSLVERLANGWLLEDVTEFIEGDLPRRLYRVTQKRPRAATA